MLAMAGFCCMDAEGGGAVDVGHHDVHEDGVGLVGLAAMEMPSAPELAVRISQPAVASRERAATSRMSSSSSMIKNASHERTYSLMRRGLGEVT